MNQGENEILEEVLLADTVLETVLNQLKIDHEDLFFRALMKNMLRRQAKDQIILAIWTNLTDEQSKHLREFLRQSRITAKWLTEENIVIEFGMLYDDLKQKMFNALSDFFKAYIERYNSSSEA